MSRYGPTLLRIALGIILAMNGYLALFVLEPSGAADMFTVMGLPLGEVLAWYLIVAHVVGGLMMIAGLWTRWAALANLPIILIPVLRLHLYQGFFMTGTVMDAASGKARVGGLEYPLLVLAATAALILLGGGAWAMTEDR